MKLNLKKALDFMKKDIASHFGKLHFDYKIENDEAKAICSGLSIRNVTEDALLIVKAYVGGGVTCTLVLDKIDALPHSLKAINDYNRAQSFFTAFANDKGYLELRNFFICYELDMLKEYASEFLCRVADFSEDEDVLELVKYTYAD